MAVDVVALASVLSSAVVASGTLAVTYRGQKAQRAHEASLAFEERAWKEKSESLYNAIMWSRQLADSMRREDPAQRALTLSRTDVLFGKIVGSMEAYTSAECREAFSDLREAIDETGADWYLDFQVTNIRRAKEQAIDGLDFPEAAKQRDQERNVMNEAAASYTYEPDHLRRLAEAVIEQARLNVQSTQPPRAPRWWQRA